MVWDSMTGEGEFGTIGVGKRADLILVKDNPLEVITSMRKPPGVMTAGRGFSQETLAESTDRASPPAYETE